VKHESGKQEPEEKWLLRGWCTSLVRSGIFRSAPPQHPTGWLAENR
jgi:hypothetical protein